MSTVKKLIIILLIVTAGANAQTLVWVGQNNDTDFFNELNWIDSETGKAPPSGTIEPGIALNKDMIIENGVVTASRFTGVKLTLTGDSKLYLNDSSPLDEGSEINITSYDAWIFLPAINAVSALENIVPKIHVFGETLVDMTNARISQYYAGIAIAGFKADLTPLKVYDGPSLSGNFGDIPVDIIRSATSIPNNMNNRISSFKLKKGYMVTLAVEPDGTGMSKVYIASESDLTVDMLPSALDNAISFIRVVPWIWVNKKGTGKLINGVGASWFYDWGKNNNSLIDREYAVMGWGKTSLGSVSERNAVISKKKITHVMSFNEPDDCNGQSGQWGKLCVVDTAEIYHRNTMKLGLRIVSPSGRESAELNWLKNMNILAVPAGTRMDVIAMHWYDWGASPKTTPNADPVEVFNRFKNKVTACYNYYKMPIWITEFNANPSRTRAVQDGFLKLALPWLEQTPYVERYAYFQPNGGNGDFFDAQGNITSTGEIYLNHISTPSIKEENINKYGNNLEGRMNTPVLPDGEYVFSDDFEKYSNDTGMGSQGYTVWEGTGKINSGSAYSGSKYVNCTGTVNKTFYFRKQNLKLEAGKTYVFEVSTKAVDGKAHNIGVKSGRSSAILVSDQVNTSWVKHQIRFIPEGTDADSVAVYVNFFGVGNIYVDDMRLYKVDDSTDVPEIEQIAFFLTSLNDTGLYYVHSREPILNIKIFDTKGQLLKELTDCSNLINLSDITNGIYMLCVRDITGNSQVKKLILHKS
ncbi:MAG: glycosyl hydrolase [Paludibacter sp.]|nr:glycosyl hydrolase [Paludibacter sp.]